MKTYEVTYYPAVEDAIRLYMRANGYREQDLADRLGISQSGVNFVLRRGFGKNAARKWADAFGFDPVFLLTGEGQLMAAVQDATPGPVSVPLVPLAAMAGSLSDYEGSAEMRDCELIMSPVKDVTMAVPVSGDSMSPEFPNGSVVLVKRINERAFIEWGRTYVLDTVNGVVIKNLVPSERGNEWVRCMSINEAPQFAPFDVSLQDVRAVYRVVMSLSRK